MLWVLRNPETLISENVVDNKDKCFVNTKWFFIRRNVIIVVWTVTYFVNIEDAFPLRLSREMLLDLLNIDSSCVLDIFRERIGSSDIKNKNPTSVPEMLHINKLVQLKLNLHFYLTSRKSWISLFGYERERTRKLGPSTFTFSLFSRWDVSNFIPTPQLSQRYKNILLTIWKRNCASETKAIYLLEKTGKLRERCRNRITINK